jgi:hypothetical protein
MLNRLQEFANTKKSSINFNGGANIYPVVDYAITCFFHFVRNGSSRNFRNYLLKYKDAIPREFFFWPSDIATSYIVASHSCAYGVYTSFISSIFGISIETMYR